MRRHARRPDESVRGNRIPVFEFHSSIRITAHSCFRPDLDAAIGEFALREAAEVFSEFRKNDGARMHEHDTHILFRDVWVKAHGFAHEIV